MYGGLCYSKRILKLKLTQINYCQYHGLRFELFILESTLYPKSLRLDILNHYEAFKVHQLRGRTDNISIFYNLINLELFKCCWDLVLRMIHHCPKLQNLIVREGVMEVMIKKVGRNQNAFHNVFYHTLELALLFELKVKGTLSFLYIF